MSSAMEFVIVFFVLVVLALLAWPFLVIGGVAGLSASSKRTASKELARKDEVLAELFDGRPVVTYRVNLESLPFPLVVESAPEFGYALTSQESIADGLAKDLVFTRQGAPTT